MTEESGAAQPLPLEVVPVPNKGSMSDEPTNAVIVGTDMVYIIDPGDLIGADLVRAALEKRGPVQVLGILLTHGHPDHVRAAPALREHYHCPLWLHPKEVELYRHFGNLSAIDHDLAAGQTFTVAGGMLEALDSPGHSPGHIVFYDRAGRTLIAGDLVAGHGTVGIFPPLGKMSEYFASLRRMQELSIDRIIPGHGNTMTQPPDVFQNYLDRRSNREREILAMVTEQPTTIDTIVEKLYPTVVPHFRHAAAATSLAHLEKLREEGKVTVASGNPLKAVWQAS